MALWDFLKQPLGLVSGLYGAPGTASSVTPKPPAVSPVKAPTGPLSNYNIPGYGSIPVPQVGPGNTNPYITTGSSSATGGARPGSELLRPAADLGAVNGPGGAGAGGAPAGDDYSDYNALLAKIAGGFGGGSDSYSGSALAGLKLSQPGSILNDLMAQLGQVPNLPTMDINKMATNAIKSKYDPQYQAIADRLASLGIEFNQGTSREQGYGQRADTALQGIYDALNKTLQSGNQRTLGYYDQAGQASESAYDQAMAALQGLNQQVQGTLGGQAAGIGAGMPMDPTGPLGRIMANFASQQGTNIGNKANTLGNLATTRANAGQFGENQLARAMNTGAQTRGDIQSQMQNALSQLNLGKVRGEGELGREKLALQRQQPLDLERIIGELTNQQYTQQEAARKARLGEMDVLGNLDLGQQRNTLTGQGNQISLAKAQQSASSSKTNNDLQRAALLLKNVPAPPNSPAGVQQAQGKANLGLTQARQQNIVNPPPKPDPFVQRQQNLDQFLTTPQQGLWGQKAGPIFAGAVQELIKGSGAFGDPSAKLAPDPAAYNNAKALLNDPKGLFGPKGKYKNQDKIGLLKAIDAYFSGSYAK